MKIKIVALIFCLSFCFYTKPATMAIAATANSGSGFSLAGLAVSPPALAIASGVILAKWVYFNFLYDFIPGPLKKIVRGRGKYIHIFGKKNRKKHGFQDDHSPERIRQSEELIEENRKKGKFTKEGKYELRKVVREGVELVVRIYVTAKGIDYGTMFLQNKVCGHAGAAVQYKGADMTFSEYMGTEAMVI